MDERSDPLRLENFFPCPKPLLTNLANDSLIPTPDYVEYQDQAAELDSLTQRIANITKALKVAGIYDASAEGLNRLFNEGTENELIPVQNWALFSEKGGIDGAMGLIPLKDIASALIGLYEARDKVKADLDEITGMSDIIRGATDARETATAQKLKAGFGSQRISDRQREVQRFVRETIRLMVDVISNHFQLQDTNAKQISGCACSPKPRSRLLRNGGKPRKCNRAIYPSLPDSPTWWAMRIIFWLIPGSSRPRFRPASPRINSPR